MYVPLRAVLTLALCCLLLPLVARAQELLPAVSFRTVANVQFDMWPADFNRDGMTDVVALGSSRFLQVWIGNGDGTFRAPIVSSAHVEPIATGDVNGDGRADAIGAFLFQETGRVDLVVVPGRGDGTFSAPVSIYPVGSGLDFAVLADLDNDGRLDLIGGFGGETRELLIWPGNGDFTFDEPVPVMSGGEGARAAFVIDVNGDGLRDVAVAHEFSGLYLLTNTANFTFTASPVPSGSGRTTDVTARDVNGDGAVDLLISGRTGAFFGPWIEGHVFVAVGNGKGTFTAGGEYPSGRGANSIVAGDFTRDGVVDVATLNYSYWITRPSNCFGEMFESGNSVSVLEGNGDGTFGLPTTFAVQPQRGDRMGTFAPFSLGTLNTSDLNRDRFPDLLVGDGTILLPIAPRANRAPTALAGDDYRTTNSAEMLLDGTGTDPDGHFLEFQWTGGAGGTLLEGNQPMACYQEPTVTGQHTFTLTVSDGHGGIDSDDLAVYLVRPPTVTLLAPVQGEVVPAGQPYTIRWTATSEDPLKSFSVFGLRDGGGIFFEVEGCINLPATARECTWTNTGAPTANAQLEIGVEDVSRQFGSDTSGPFMISGVGPVPTGWQNRDIGAVGATGRASFVSGVFSVTGSGADIWGTADEFHYTYTTASRNFEVVARVASVQNIDQWTKAGVMIREGTGAGARHASIFITPTTVKGVAFQRRPTAGGASVHTPGPSLPTPGWVRLMRDGDTVTAYHREFPSNSWDLIGTQVFPGLAETLLVGLAVTSHVDRRLATATFDSVGLTSDFQSADIGAVGVPGTTSVNSTGVIIEGSGTDIWGTADAFRYYYRPWTGDGTITVRAESIENTHVWAKAGVMFRETLAANSRQVMAIVSPGKGVAVQYRRATGGSSQNVALTAGTAPEWLRLTRSGDLFSAEASENGTTWRTLGSITIPMASSVFVGLPVTSHNNSTLATGVFDHPAVGP